MDKIGNHIKLKDIELCEDLNMEEVYKVLKKNKSKMKMPFMNINLIIPINDKYKIKIIHIFVDTITFEINDLEFDNLFKTSLNYKLKLTDGTSIDLEIICIQQIKEIERLYKFNKLLLYCSQCDKISNIIITDIYIHRSHKDVFLKEGSKLTKLSFSEFKNFFKEKSASIGKKYKPLDFEPNFKNYFKKLNLFLKMMILKFMKMIIKKDIN